MAIDVGIGAIILVFALIGLASGFWGQILRLVALGSLYFLAPPVARFIEEPVANALAEEATPFMVQGTSLIVAAVGLYIAMSILIAIILKVVRRGEKISGGSRFAGFLLGAVKGTALAYLLLNGLVLVAEDKNYSSTLEESKWSTWASESYLVELVKEHNVLEQMGVELPTPEEIQEHLGTYAPDALDDLADESDQPATPETSTPAQPGAAQPGVVQPGMVQPGVVQPGAVQPGVVQPGAVQPVVVQPGMVQPGAVQPGGAYHAVPTPVPVPSVK